MSKDKQIPPTDTQLEPKDTPQKPEPALNPKGVVCIKGNMAVTYDTALDFGHQIGIGSFMVEPLQLPTAENGHYAVCSATLITIDDKIFHDIGDASPENAPAGCRDSLLRLASTRAKNRVLNDAFNIAQKILEMDTSAVIDTQAVVQQGISALPWNSEHPQAGNASAKPISDKQKA